MQVLPTQSPADVLLRLVTPGGSLFKGEHDTPVIPVLAGDGCRAIGVQLGQAGATTMTSTDTTHSSDATSVDRAEVLRTESLTRRFGSLTAVDHVDLIIPEGQLRSIIGPNGAGKTTFFNLVTGALRPSSGSIRFLGKDITDLSMDARARRGIVRAYQITQVFPSLSVKENLRLAIQAQEQDFNPLHKSEETWDRRAAEMFDRLEITGTLESPVSMLSHGEKKKLEVGMSVLTDPDLLLLDEPTSGLSRDASDHVIEFLSDIAEEYTILLIEHDVDMVLSISDRITVLHQGAILAEGSPDEIAGDERVQEAYLGGSHERTP